jgi:hypothetical protein
VIVLSLIMAYGVFEFALFRRDFHASRYWPKTVEREVNLFDLVADTVYLFDEPTGEHQQYIDPSFREITKGGNHD